MEIVDPYPFLILLRARGPPKWAYSIKLKGENKIRAQKKKIKVGVQ